MNFMIAIIVLLIGDIIIYVRLCRKYKENKKLEKRISELTNDERRLFRDFFLEKWKKYFYQ